MKKKNPWRWKTILVIQISQKKMTHENLICPIFTTTTELKTTVPLC